MDFALLGYFDQTEAQCRAAEIRAFLIGCVRTFHRGVNGEGITVRRGG